MKSKCSAAVSSWWLVVSLLCCSGGLWAQTPDPFPAPKKAFVGPPIELPNDTNDCRWQVLMLWDARQQPGPALRPFFYLPQSTSSQQFGQLDLELGLAPPPRNVLFRSESEGQFRERLSQEGLQQKIKLAFPADNRPDLPISTELARRLPPAAAASNAGIVCHCPLYFEDRNTERYGWYVPWLQPALSTGRFYCDTLCLPYRMVCEPPCRCECDETFPAPGDVVPFWLHLP